VLGEPACLGVGAVGGPEQGLHGRRLEP
jgi:hypothetical protein